MAAWGGSGSKRSGFGVGYGLMSAYPGLEAIACSAGRMAAAGMLCHASIDGSRRKGAANVRRQTGTCCAFGVTNV